MYSLSPSNFSSAYSGVTSCFSSTPGRDRVAGNHKAQAKDGRTPLRYGSQSAPASMAPSEDSHSLESYEPSFNTLFPLKLNSIAAMNDLGYAVSRTNASSSVIPNFEAARRTVPTAVIADRSIPICESRHNGAIRCDPDGLVYRPSVQLASLAELDRRID